MITESREMSMDLFATITTGLLIGVLALINIGLALGYLK